MRSHIEQNIPHHHPEKPRMEKMFNAAEKAFVDRSLLLGENQTLFQQSNERTVRSSRRAAMIGHVTVMTYDDIVEAEKKRGDEGKRKEINQRDKKEASSSRLVEEARKGRGEIKTRG